MKIGVYYPNKFPAFSIKIYTDILIEELTKLGVECKKIASSADINNELDIIWDPQTGGANPTFIEHKHKIPIVITMHGAALFTLPVKDNIYKFKTAIKIIAKKIKYKQIWNVKRKFIDNVICVSEFGKHEAIKQLNFKHQIVNFIYHGVDERFINFKSFNFPKNEKIFLHISQYQPKKNLNRLIRAFEIANNKNSNIKLKIICPGYPNLINNNNIKLVNTYIHRDEVIKEYHNSFAFIFPSLHETFGLPILEAMASGLPVITSKTTACGEIAADNALLVNPYKIQEIADAILKLAEDENIYKALYLKGIQQAKKFTWEKTALNHSELFKKLLNDAK